MSLEHAILVSLSETSATGYDLTRRFDRSIGQFWRATHQQIYRTLARMETGGLVTAEVVPQQGRPDRKVHAITEAGRDALAAWIAEPGPVEQTRSALAVRVRGLRRGDPLAVAAEVERHRDAHAERLTELHASRERHYPDPTDVADDDIGPYLVLRGGIRTEQAVVEWCDEVLQALADAGVSAPGPEPATAGPARRPAGRRAR